MYFFAVGADIPKASATFRIVFFVQSFPVFLDLADQDLFFYGTVPGRGIVPMKGRVFYCHMSFLCCPGCGKACCHNAGNQEMHHPAFLST